METFDFRWPRWFALRGLGRNPLLRWSDRIESLTTVIAVIVTVVAIPIAAAVGTSVYDARALVYRDQARTLHRITADVLDGGRPESAPLYEVVYSTSLRWTWSGAARTATVDWPSRVEAGETVELWLDAAGDPAAPPATPDQAAREAIASAFIVWVAATGCALVVLGFVRWRLAAVRLRGWDTALSTPADRGGPHRPTGRA